MGLAQWCLQPCSTCSLGQEELRLFPFTLSLGIEPPQESNISHSPFPEAFLSVLFFHWMTLQEQQLLTHLLFP